MTINHLIVCLDPISVYSITPEPQFICYDGATIPLAWIKDLSPTTKRRSMHFSGFVCSWPRGRCKTCLTVLGFTDSSPSIRIMKAVVLKITARKQSVAL